jgi:membrane protein
MKINARKISKKSTKNILSSSRKVWKNLKSFFSNPFFLTLIIVDLILVSFMYVGPGNLIKTHDGNYHLYRFATSISAFDDGQKFLQLDADQLQGFGQAPNLFYGPMLSWLVLVVFKITSNLQISLMFLMLFATIATTFGAYYASKKIFKSEKAGFFTALFFTLEPFHVGELLARGSFSEYLAFAFIPFIILAIYRIIFESKTDFKRIFMLAFSAFGIIMNHNLTAVLIAAMAALFVVFNIRKVFSKPKILFSLILAGILAVGFSAIFILPFLEVREVGIYNIFNPDFQKWFYVNGSQVTPADAWLPTNMFRPPAGHASVVFGLSPVLLVLTIGFLVFRKDIKNTNYRRFLMMSIIISAIFVLFSTRIFAFIPAVQNFHSMLQFSQRMLIIQSVLLPFVAGYFIGEKLKNKREIMIAAAIASISYIHITTSAIEPGKVSLPMNVGVDYNLVDGISIAMGEYQPIFPKVENVKDISATAAGYVKKTISEKGQKADVISGSAKISGFEKKGSRMRLAVSENKNGAEIELPMFYYPGFKAVLNGKLVKTSYSSKNRMVSVKLNPGQNGALEVYYGISPATKIGSIVSGLSFLACGLFMVIKRYKNAK